MFIEFSVGNFKSFRETTTFSLIAAPIKSDDPALDTNNVIPISKKLSLLRSAAIYGANASGKSNLGVALRFMREFVLLSSSEGWVGGAISVEPFRLSIKTQDKPSSFEVVFRRNGIQYRYGFEATRNHVVAEWLYHVQTTKEAVLFLREGQNITVKDGFREGKGLQGRTRKNALFLSVVAQFDGKLANDIQSWFVKMIVTTGLQDDEFRTYTIECLLDEVRREEVISLVRKLDLGLDDVQIAEDNKIYIKHLLYDAAGQPVGEEFFGLDKHESMGTRKLIALAGPLLSVLEQGMIFFVDELDARLHPSITRAIINLFHSPETNPKGAQLVFVTHDTNLLDKALFRRDQIWFAEKDHFGATHLTSLVEFRARNDAAFEKNYLEGRYGAIPYVGDLTRLPSFAPEPEMVHA